MTYIALLKWLLFKTCACVVFVLMCTRVHSMHTPTQTHPYVGLGDSISQQAVSQVSWLIASDFSMTLFNRNAECNNHLIFKMAICQHLQTQKSFFLLASISIMKTQRNYESI